MNSIDSYIILNKNFNFCIKFYIFVSLLISLIFIISLQFNYKKYYNTFGHVIKDNYDYQLLIYIPLDKLEIIKSNNKLIIDEKVYNYKIDNIYTEYMIDNNLKNIVKISLNINLESKDRIINNILNIKFEEKHQKIIYYLKDYLMKGSNI